MSKTSRFSCVLLIGVSADWCLRRYVSQQTCVSADYFLGKKTAFTQASLFKKGRLSYVMVLADQCLIFLLNSRNKDQIETEFLKF